ncbi:MAG: PspC domain-containing protein [Gammaproteobacteria bacterium]
MATGPNKLHINHEDRICLGVCAGIADWLDIPTSLVRLVFVICTLTWPTMIVGYFIHYLCLDRDITPDRMRDYFSNAKTVEHFRQLNYRKPIYRNTRDKRVAGVCAGIADYLEVSHFTVRLVTILSLFVFGPFTFWAYVICWFVFEPDPHMPVSSYRARRRQRREARSRKRTEKYEKWRKRYHSRRRNGYVNVEIEIEDDDGADIAEETEAKYEHEQAQPAYSRKQCSDIYHTLEMRLREIEAFMTSKKFALHCQLNRI